MWTLTCRSVRWALAGVLYSVRPCVCRSTGRLRDPARTDASSSLSSDHNMAHKRWMGRQGQRWGGERERAKETDYYSVQSHPFCQKATHRSALTCTPVCASWSQRDEFVDGLVLHTGDHQVGKHPSSKITPPPTPRGPSLINRHSELPSLLLTCRKEKLRFGSCNTKRRILSGAAHLSDINARQRRLEGPFGAPLRQASFYWVKTGRCGCHRDIKPWLSYPIDILNNNSQLNTKIHFSFTVRSLKSKQTNLFFL